MSRRSDGYSRAEAQATGCLLGLLLFAFAAVIQGVVELFKYRPQPYVPASPYHPTQGLTVLNHPKLRWFVKLIGAITAFFAVISLLGNCQPYQMDCIELGLDKGFFYSGVGLIGLGLAFFLKAPPIVSSIRIRLLVKLGGLLIGGASFGFAAHYFTNGFISEFWLGWGLLGATGLGLAVFVSVASPIKSKQVPEKPEALPVSPPTIYTIYPAKTKVDYVTTSKFIHSLLAACPRLTFQIAASHEEILWRIVDPLAQYEPSVITGHITSQFPQAAVTVDTTGEAEIRYFTTHYQQVIVFRLLTEYGVPLPFLEQLKAYDPLISITNRMDALTKEDLITYSVMSLVATPQARQRALERFKGGYITPLTDVRRETERETTRFEFNEQLVTAKLSSELYHCYVMVTVKSTKRARIAQLAQVATDVTQYQLTGHNQVVEYWKRDIEKVDEAAEAARTLDFEALLTEWTAKYPEHWRTSLMVLAPQEIAALWHLPNETFSARRIIWMTQPAPEQLTAISDGVCVGTSITPGQSVRVGIDSRDRAYHHYMIGKTGMGKSTLLHTLIQQDIAAGRGIAVIDPHGKLIRDVLKTVGERCNDVVLLECGRADYPVPLNPLRILPGVPFDAVRKNIISALEKIYEDIFQYPGVQRTLNVVVNALLCDPEATLLDVYRLFNDESYRHQLISLVQNSPHGTEQTVQELEQFGAATRSGQERRAEPIITRTAALISNRVLENMLCHPSSLDFSEMIRERKIVLIDLSGDAVSTEAGSLATLFLSNFFTASQKIGNLPDGAPPKFYLYLDEAQRVMSGAVIAMLSEVRKFGLSLTLTHQFLGQLRSENVGGILGNVGTLLVFEVGNEDARALAPYFEPDIERGQLVNLGAYHIAVKTRAQGRTLPGFILETDPAPPKSVLDCAEALKGTRPDTGGLIHADEIRDWLKQRRETGKQPAATRKTTTRKPATPRKPTPPKPRKPKEFKDFE